MTLIFDWIVLIVSNLLIILFMVSSILEKEWRAAFISLLIFGFNSGWWFFLILAWKISWVFLLNHFVLLIVAVFGAVTLFKFFPQSYDRDLSQIKKYDERDHMFSRNSLQFQKDRANLYYANHPEKRAIDLNIHKKPELGEPGGSFYDKDYSPWFEAAFRFLKLIRVGTYGKPSPEKQPLKKKKLLRLIKELALFYGAVDVGVTPLKDYHLYSHAGRHVENWGEEIKNNHHTAIVIVVAMKVGMIKSAPDLPVILESSRQYVEAAKIASIIAQYLRDLGYDARAHTDGNYQVLCVPIAVDSGLGALGRIGLFMHPVYGPCVRLAVVTTQLDLAQVETGKILKKKPHIASIAHFCEICKKCAHNCPTQSICYEEEPVNRGFCHWSINQETCYSYWKTIGTDCGFCIGVCPYTKPNTLMHRLVRFYISRNWINQRIALFMDDLFYGRRQKRKSGTGFLKKKRSKG